MTGEGGIEQREVHDHVRGDQEEPIVRVTAEGHGHLDVKVGRQAHPSLRRDERECAVEAGAIPGREQLLGIRAAAWPA